MFKMNSVGPTVNNRDIICKAVFNDGNAFRCLFNVVMTEIDKTVMVFSSEAITIEFQNKSNNIIHNIYINKNNIKEYYYNNLDSDGNLIPYTYIGFETKTIFSAIKNIGRNDSFEIIHRLNSQMIEVRPIPTSNKNSTSDIFKVRIEHVDQSSIITNKSIVYPTTPNLKIDPKGFTSFIQRCVVVKSEYVVFVIYKNGLIIRGIKADDSELYRSNHGFEEGVKLDAPYNGHKYKVPINNIKALSKFANVPAKNSFINFYFEGNSECQVPIKLVSQIGPNCGTYTMYIAKINDESMRN